MKNLQALLERIEKSMYGHNFEITLGIDVFDGNGSTEFEKAVKLKYPKTNPEQFPLIGLDKDELLSDIQDKLNYRGDRASGLNLNEKEEKELQILIDQYFQTINGYLNNNTKCFYYSDVAGLPGYPVFWEYGYVLFTDMNKIILIFGSASD